MRKYVIKVRVDGDPDVEKIRADLTAFLNDFLEITEAKETREMNSVENGRGMVTRRQKIKAIDLDDIELEGEIYEREVYRSGHITSYTIEVNLEELW